MNTPKKHVMRVDIHEDDNVIISIQTNGDYCAECLKEYIKYAIEDLTKVLNNIGNLNENNDRAHKH